MDTMVYCIATRKWDGWLDCVHTWRENASRKYPEFIVYDKKVLDAYQECWLESQDFLYSDPILAFIHEDVNIFEKDWDLRVLKEFDDPQVGMVGFGGAPGHCRPALYTEPFNIGNMIRLGFRSNLRNAEAHGQRIIGEQDVAVLDGFAIFVRRSILDKVGGWPVDKPIGYWMYSEWACCETRRQGYKIRLVGVDCEHIGGKTAAIANVTDDFESCHRYLFETCRDVLPCIVGGGQ
jgi:hypothetical protein